MCLFRKSPEKKYISARKKIAKLANKRKNLSPYDYDAERKRQKYNLKMSIEYAKIDAIKMQLQNPQPQQKTTNITTNITANVKSNKQTNSKSLHVHLHKSNKKKK